MPPDVIKAYVENGVLAATVLVAIVGLWKAARTFATWAERVISQWEKNETSRTTGHTEVVASQVRLFDAFTTAQLGAVSRSAELEKHITVEVKETRHHLSNALVRSEANIIEHLIDQNRRIDDTTKRIDQLGDMIVDWRRSGDDDDNEDP